jgi:hypothetical protein
MAAAEEEAGRHPVSGGGRDHVPQR